MTVPQTRGLQIVLLMAVWFSLVPMTSMAGAGEADDEFVAWEEGGDAAVADVPLAEDGGAATSCPGQDDGCGSCVGVSSGARTVVAVLITLVVAGALLRTRWGVRLRPFFLLGSLVVLGFVRGGCPCPIKGFQEGVLAVLGGPRQYVVLAWFLALVPLTYLLGRVWCGWLCHLGALQEFLHRTGVVPKLGASAIRRLRWVRRAVFVALLVQLLIVRRNLWEANDPFQAVFNLMVPSTWVAWTLLVALLVTSLLVYRPFCRTLCPVGLVLGWIGALPGAARLRPTTACTSCMVCRKRCSNGAIDSDSVPVAESCIACGECTAGCPQHALVWRHGEPKE